MDGGAESWSQSRRGRTDVCWEQSPMGSDWTLLLCANVLVVTRAREPATPANHWSDVISSPVGETEVVDRVTGEMQKGRHLKDTRESVLLDADTPLRPGGESWSAVVTNNPQKFSEMFWFPCQIPDWVITLHPPTIPLAFSVDHDVPGFLT